MFSALRNVSRTSSLRFRPHVLVPVQLRQSPFVRTLITTKYTAAHEKIVYDDETTIGTVFLTHHAQNNLSDVVFVELPALGKQVAAGDQIGAVESVKAASDIYSPVSGTIQEINSELDNQPGLIKKSAEDKAWLCRIKLSKPEEISELMDAEAYNAHCETS